MITKTNTRCLVVDRVLAELQLESDTVLVHIVGVDVVDDIASILVENLILFEGQDDAHVVEELDLALLAGFVTDAGIFVGSVVVVLVVGAVVLEAVLELVVSGDGVGLEEGGCEVLLEAVGVELGNGHVVLAVVGLAVVGLVVNQCLTRLVHNTDVGFFVLVIDRAGDGAGEGRIGHIGLGVEYVGSASEAETAARVAATGKCEGCEGEDNGDGD